MTKAHRPKLMRTTRWFLVTVAVTIGSTVPAFAGPINFGTWGEFSFTDVGVQAAGCDPADPNGGFCIASSGTPTAFLDAAPWTFTAPAVGASLTVTDAFLSGDQFEVFDFGVSLGLTSAPVGGIDCGDDPVPCLLTPEVSSARFLLAAGDHSITIAPTQSPDGGGSGYLLAQVVPEPGSMALLGFGLAAAGLYHQVKFRRRRDRHQG